MHANYAGNHKFTKTTIFREKTCVVFPNVLHAPLQAAVLVWLQVPREENGSSRLYRGLLVPLYTLYKEEIEMVLGRLERGTEALGNGDRHMGRI